MGNHAIFDSHGADSGLKHRDGTVVEVLGPLDESQYDRCETGPMFRIRFSDSYQTDAFADELSVDYCAKSSSSQQNDR